MIKPDSIGSDPIIYYSATDLNHRWNIRSIEVTTAGRRRSFSVSDLRGLFMNDANQTITFIRRGLENPQFYTFYKPSIELSRTMKETHPAVLACDLFLKNQ